MKKSLKNGLLILLMGSGLTMSCHKDLNLTPTNEGSANAVYRDAKGYKEALSRVYSAMALSSNSAPADDPDLPLAGDAGASDFFRGFWKLQELSTDEAVVAWGDVGLPDIHNMTWTSNNGTVQKLYFRSFFQITLCNAFIRESDPALVASRGITDPEIAYYRAEARFLRAYQYWVLMDLVGNVAFVTENDLIGTNLPKQIKREDLFVFIESELKALETLLKPARSNDYGRADQAAAQALLARMYLNAEAYLGAGKTRYNEAVEYATKVINAGYSLGDDYQRMMSANNDMAPMKNEFIFTINYDGLRTRTFGGTTFLINASIGGVMNSRQFGSNGNWAGLRTTRNLPLLFPDTGRFGDNGVDKRAMFFTQSQTLDIADVRTFTDGFAVTKFRNHVMTPLGSTDSLAYDRDSIFLRTSASGISRGGFIKLDQSPDWFLNGTYPVGSVRKLNNGLFLVKVRLRRRASAPNVATGQATLFRLDKGTDPDQGFMDIDIPIFRLAEMYLIYAEATLRGGNGNAGTALNYINALRTRAYGGKTDGNISADQLTLNFILDERGRELYWEGHRRTDLIRYNRFTEGDYLWPWKGGVAAGRGVESFRKLYPVPSPEINANPNLKQNPGY